MCFSGSTDNQGNARLSQKHLTARFPLCAVLVETVARMSKVGRTLQLNWLPRDQNQAADELTNELFHRFDPDLRVAIQIEEIKWEVLPGLVSYGIEMYDEVERTRKRRGGSTEAPDTSEGKRKRQGALDPW